MPALQNTVILSEVPFVPHAGRMERSRRTHVRALKASSLPKRASQIALLLTLPVLALPLHAQSSPGPVHLPAGVTNVAPAFNQYLAPTPVPSQNNPAPSQPIAVPSPSAPGNTDTGDIHDIRGPIAIPIEYLWAMYIIGGLALAALIYGVFRFIRGRTKPKPKLPHEIALERLEAARRLMSTETVREYAFTVSEIIRVYIEQRFDEKASRRTTEEFLSDLVNLASSPLAAHRGRLEEFLGHCDLIKYARWSASTRELESMHESARVFIVETQPRLDVPKPVADPNAVVLPPIPSDAQLTSAK